MQLGTQRLASARGKDSIAAAAAAYLDDWQLVPEFEWMVLVADIVVAVK